MTKVNRSILIGYRLVKFQSKNNEPDDNTHTIKKFDKLGNFSTATPSVK